MSSRGMIVIGILFATLILPGTASACSCMWGGPFTKVALGTELIVLGEVTSHYKNSMDVNVLEVFKGIQESKTIRVWGDTGALCRPYVSHFPIGTTWLLAVQKTTGEHPPSFWERLFPSPRTSDYAISICGDFWLQVRDERAVGRIALPEFSSALQWVPLQDMLAWLRSGGTAPKLSPSSLSGSGR